ncbi:hypothetical protein VNO77_25914 [Canavalia gladiata]|uniref:Uncharacterized protein n=1 Tax=Canavalia gladiata TaxID=3824 RepID=A0AAN9KSB1_CANGL
MNTMLSYFIYFEQIESDVGLCFSYYLARRLQLQVEEVVSCKCKLKMREIVNTLNVMIFKNLSGLFTMVIGQDNTGRAFIW